MLEFELGYTADQLVAKLEELDLQEGEADGKVARPPVDCPSCDSRVAAGLDRCQFWHPRLFDEGHPLSQM